MQKSFALPDRPLLAACPVSVRNEETADIDSANKVSAMFVSLPTHLEDVDAQIEHIRETTKGAKEEHLAVGARTLLELGELAGPLSFGLASRLLGGLASRHTVPINLVISNVPGPPFPLYAPETLNTFGDEKVPSPLPGKTAAAWVHELTAKATSIFPSRLRSPI